ncbi:MAG TPA: hypothetical protein VGJ25_10820 [Gaiellaceae bacterium]
MEQLEEHATQVSKGRRWWTPFAVQEWVLVGVAIVTAIVIAAATIAYLIA